VDCGGGLLVDGAGPFAAMDNAEEGVRSSSLDGDGTDDGSARRPWRVERQRPRIATIVVMGFVLAGPEPVEGNESVRDSREGQRPMVAMAAFILADASAVEDDIVCAQPRGLLLCFGQRDPRCPPSDERGRTGACVSIFHGPARLAIGPLS
jgi:hypothetical protein